MSHWDEYEDRMGHCQEVVEDHSYRVVTFRRCQNQARWLVRGRWMFNGQEFEKKLCTRHKNEMVKFANMHNYEIISVEELPREQKSNNNG